MEAKREAEFFFTRPRLIYLLNSIQFKATERINCQLYYYWKGKEDMRQTRDLLKDHKDLDKAIKWKPYRTLNFDVNGDHIGHICKYLKRTTYYCIMWEIARS